MTEGCGDGDRIASSRASHAWTRRSAASQLFSSSAAISRLSGSYPRHAMWADRVVMAPPRFDENLGFLQSVKYLPVQELVAQPGIETLDVAVLPGRSRLDEGGAGPRRGDPPARGLGDELRAVVGTDVGRDA